MSLEDHKDKVTSLAINSNGKYLVSGCEDKTIIIWDLEKFGIISILKGHSGSVYCVALSLDCKLIVSGSYDNTVMVWDF